MAGTQEAERALERAAAAYDPFDLEALITHLSEAIRVYTAAGEPCRAAMVCVQLGHVMANVLGNLTAAKTWFTRASQLVEHQPPCLEQGWVAIAAMGCDVDDSADLLSRAELALDRARHFGDLNLETKALADAGLAHVQLGQIEHGMAMLDEAMTLACGPADNGEARAKSVCSFFTACYVAVDFARADSWSGLLRQQGLIGGPAPESVFLSSHCDSVQATLLMELGRWSDAETILLQAKGAFEAAMGSDSSWHPDIALADLRTRQGRYAEAEALLLGKDNAIQALLPSARLHLERGDAELSRALAERGLRLMGTDRLRAAELLTVLVDAHLHLGDVDAAGAAREELERRVSGVAIPALQARSTAAGARVLAAREELPGAIAALETALDQFDARQLPWLRATLLLDLARLRDRIGDRRMAELAASDAHVTLLALDVQLRRADLELLRHLTPDRLDSSSAASTLTRSGSWWVAESDGTRVRLRDSKGLSYLAELLAAPGAERHVLDLVDRIEGVAADGQADRRTLGDAGELIDTQARTAYRHRIEALRAEVDDALEDNRLEAAEALQDELDALVEQLAQAFGLGGRSRVAASTAERARLNVTRALRSALARLSEALPGPGAALDRSVRTGLYCRYNPADDEGRWIVHP